MAELAIPSQRQLALFLGLAPGVISRYLTSKRDPDRDQLELIATKTGFDLTWLSTGKGQPRGPSDRWAIVTITLADARSTRELPDEVLEAARERLTLREEEPTEAEIWQAVEEALDGREKAMAKIQEIKARRAKPQ